MVKAIACCSKNGEDPHPNPPLFEPEPQSRRPGYLGRGKRGMCGCPGNVARKLISPAIFCVAVLISAMFLAQSPAASDLTASPPPFLLGADISNLSAGRGGSGFGFGATRPTTQAARFARPPLIYRENGKTGSELGIMMNHGWNAFRLRVFVDPVRSAPNNTLANTIVLARQIKAAGAVFLLDIHYSDTWADPQHQETPVAWRNLDADGLGKQGEGYTGDVLTQLK